MAEEQKVKQHEHLHLWSAVDLIIASLLLVQDFDFVQACVND